MVRYIFASHYRMADGLKETVEFLTSVNENVYPISAYVTENYNIEEEIKKVFDKFSKEYKVAALSSSVLRIKLILLRSIPSGFKIFLSRYSAKEPYPECRRTISERRPKPSLQ